MYTRTEPVFSHDLNFFHNFGDVLCPFGPKTVTLNLIYAILVLVSSDNFRVALKTPAKKSTKF